MVLVRKQVTQHIADFIHRFERHALLHLIAMKPHGDGMAGIRRRRWQLDIACVVTLNKGQDHRPCEKKRSAHDDEESYSAVMRMTQRPRKIGRKLPWGGLVEAQGSMTLQIVELGGRVVGEGFSPSGSPHRPSAESVDAMMGLGICSRSDWNGWSMLSNTQPLDWISKDTGLFNSRYLERCGKCSPRSCALSRLVATGEGQVVIGPDVIGHRW